MTSARSDDGRSEGAVVRHAFVVWTVVLHLEPGEVRSVALSRGKLNLRLDGPFDNGLRIDDDIDHVGERVAIQTIIDEGIQKERFLPVVQIARIVLPEYETALDYVDPRVPDQRLGCLLGVLVVGVQLPVYAGLCILCRLGLGPCVHRSLALALSGGL